LHRKNTKKNIYNSQDKAIIFFNLSLPEEVIDWRGRGWS